MDLRGRLLGPCAAAVEGGAEGIKEVDLDVGAFLRRVLLFDTYILESIRLLEVPQLVRILGWDGVMALLKSGAVLIQCDALSLASGRRNDESEPLNAFALGVTRVTDHEEYIHRCMEAMKEIPGLTTKQAIKLKGAIAGRLQTPLSDEAVTDADETWKRELKGNVPEIATAVSLRLTERLGRVDETEVKVHIHMNGEGYHVVESNLVDRFGLEPREARKIVEQALLGVGGINLRIEYMRHLSAVTGMREGELPLMSAKLEFLAAHLGPEAQEARFNRLVDIGNLPDLSEAAQQGRVDIERLLTIRDERECREFREWLRTLDEATHDEIRDRVDSLRARLGDFVKSGRGKTLKLLVTTALGLVPGAGPVLGGVLGAGDTFLLEKLLPESGPISFLGRLYPTIFRGC